MATIEDVKAQLDIVETVRSYVPALKKMGRAWKAPCPFHSERTPSFQVDPERRTWHCFGACSTGGDVIEFVRRFEHLEFREALQRCADRAGLELRPPSAREQRDREVHERLLRANEAAAVYFQAALLGPAGTHALAYADSRGLDAAAREVWQIGYAPDEWQGLTDHLLARGFTEQDLRDAGLAVDGDRGLYDRFRDRLIYPTRDGRGRMIGFGARALHAGQEPKYLNTPQTPLFDKSGSLYGLDRAGEEARRADRIYVVEGYMDVISCHQGGLRNVVASMGTSITEKQMLLLQRYTHNIVQMLDADAAGESAAIRGGAITQTVTVDEPGQKLARIENMNANRGVDWEATMQIQDVTKADLRVVVLPKGEDPDSLMRSNPALLQERLKSAKPLADHIFETVEARMDRSDPKARSAAIEELAPTVAVITDPIVQAHYVTRLARLGQVEERTVLAVLSRSGAVRPTPVRSAAEVTRSTKTSGAPPDGEAQLLQVLLLRLDARLAGLELDPDVFEDSTNRRLFSAWREDDDLLQRAEPLDEELEERLASLQASAIGAWDPTTLEAKHVAQRVAEIARLLRLRRAQARLLPAAVAQAVAVAEARRATTSTDLEELSADLVAMEVRQRTLSRQARGVAVEEIDTSATSYDERYNGIAAPSNPEGSASDGVEESE